MPFSYVVVQVIGTYHMDPDLVSIQMQTMKARGQNDITLVLWFCPLSPTEGQGTHQSASLILIIHQRTFMDTL